MSSQVSTASSSSASLDGATARAGPANQWIDVLDHDDDIPSSGADGIFVRIYNLDEDEDVDTSYAFTGKALSWDASKTDASPVNEAMEPLGQRVKEVFGALRGFSMNIFLGAADDVAELTVETGRCGDAPGGGCRCQRLLGGRRGATT